MTCIVGMVDHNGNVYMAADSCGSNGFTYDIQVEPKIFELSNDTEKMIFGYTSSFRFGQILKFHLKLPHKNKSQEPLNYLVECVVPEIRSILKTHGYTHIQNNVEDGGFCLIGYKGKIYKMQGDFSILSNTSGFDATGCGDAKAKAIWNYLMDHLTVSCAENSEEFENEKESVLCEILKAVSMVDSHVKGPFNTLKLKGEI